MKINVNICDVKHGTQINQISVPERMKEKIPSGIGFIDDSLGGQGFTPGMCALLTGTPGAGKSTLLLQTAHAISRRDDCVVLFNTTEESLFQVKMTYDRLFGSEDHGSFYVGEDRIVDDLNPALHPKVKKEIEEGKHKAILQHARHIMKMHPNKQFFLFVDSLQAIDDGKYHDGSVNGATPVRSIELLTNFVKETYAICVCIGQVNKGGEFSGKQAIKHIIDAHMHLKIDTHIKSETQGMRIFEVQKNRFGSACPAYILNMESNGLHEWGSVEDEY